MNVNAIERAGNRHKRENMPRWAVRLLDRMEGMLHHNAWKHIVAAAVVLGEFFFLLFHYIALKNGAIFSTLASRSSPNRISMSRATDTSWIRLGMCWNVLECVGMCWNVLECVGVCWNVLECVGMCWNVLECVGMCSNVLECVWMCWNVLESVGMCWNIPKGRVNINNFIINLCCC